MLGQNSHRTSVRRGCVAPYALKAPVEQAQVFVSHVDGELAEAFPDPGAEAAGVGPTARP